MRLEAVMDFGAHMPSPPVGAMCTEIRGCASFAEICYTADWRFFARADAAIVRGIAAILTAMVDGHTPDEIKKMDIWGEFRSLELNLGAGRVNGVNSMISFLQNL